MSVLNISDEERYNEWIGTYTGRHFHLFRPRPNDISIIDIAHSLSLTKWACRFRGQCKYHYTVAQHSVEVAQVIRLNGGTERAALFGLLHDASEAYWPDLPTPGKKHMKEYLEVEKGIQTAIEVYFLGSVPDPDEQKAVHESDMIMLATEAYALMPPPTDWGSIRGILPIENWRGPIDAEKAENEFLDMFDMLQDWGMR